jgi:hypothetical protein
VRISVGYQFTDSGCSEIVRSRHNHRGTRGRG